MVTAAMRSRRESPEIHVLAVDDCLIDRKVIEKLLKVNSFKVTTVESAAKALEVLGVNDDRPASSDCHNDLNVSMIITDYCMPGMTGYDLLKKVKETKRLEEIPVVIMSSENVPQRIKRCLAEGAEDFIIKPVQPGDIQKLRNHIKPVKRISSTSTKRKVLSAARFARKNSERRPRFGRLAFV